MHKTNYPDMKKWRLDINLFERFITLTAPLFDFDTICVEDRIIQWAATFQAPYTDVIYSVFTKMLLHIRIESAHNLLSFPILVFYEKSFNFFKTFGESQK